MTNTEDSQPQHKPGDVVNGHILTPENEWKPISPLPAEAAAPPAGATVKPNRKWYTRKRIIIPAAALLFIMIVGSINQPAKSDDVAVTEAAATVEPAVESAPAPPVQTAVPDTATQTAANATQILTSLGFKVSAVEDPEALVTGTTPAAGTLADEGSTVTLTVVVKPKQTLGQQNAVAKAGSYIGTMAFSRGDLIDQLVYNQFSVEDSTFAVDNIGADWNAQAAAKAKSYLDTMAFSRQDLIDQLIYNQFTPEQAEFGVASNGY